MTLLSIKKKKKKIIDNKKIEEMGEKKDGVAPSSSRSFGVSIRLRFEVEPVLKK